MSSNLVEDLATLTQVPQHTLSRLWEQAELVVCHSVAEKLVADDDLCVDLGFGRLSLVQQDDSLTWHFRPSKRFEQCMLQTLKQAYSPLVVLGEEVLAKKISTTYKDILG